MTKKSARRAWVVEQNTAKRKRRKRRLKKKLLPLSPEPPPTPPPVIDPFTGATVPGRESWHSSMEHNRLHCVPAGQLYARCGATAMRWMPPKEFAPVCRICRKRAVTPPPATALQETRKRPLPQP